MSQTKFFHPFLKSKICNLALFFVQKKRHNFHFLWLVQTFLFLVQNEPYTMYRENSEALSGNERFEGYNIDLISEVATILGFNYTINPVQDGKYGSYNSKNKTWNGMIGELLSQVSGTLFSKRFPSRQTNGSENGNRK